MLSLILIRPVIIAIAGLFLSAATTTCTKSQDNNPSSAETHGDFENRLEKLLLKLNIPGMSAGIVRNGQVIWTKGYGYSNLETKTPVTGSTIFHLASLTKTFASAVVIQLVKENKIDLYAPVSKYGVNLTAQDTIRVIHLLTHTSEGVPGAKYKYSGDRYAYLSNVIRAATGKDFHWLATERLMKPFGLTSTAPSIMNLAAADGFDTAYIRKNFAQGYNSAGNVKVNYPTNFSAAAGMISSLDDMMKYAAAYDDNSILTDEMKAHVFKPMISNSGATLPYALGWFIQEIEGVKLYWHYGYWVGNSSLILKVPEKKLSFVIMANSDMLSAPYNRLGSGDLWSSDFAKEFLKSFALPGAKL